MNRLYTCDDCGYALLTKETILMEWTIVWRSGIGWRRDELVPVDPVVCADKNDCIRRRRDKVAGRRVLRNIDRRQARKYARLGL